MNFDNVYLKVKVAAVLNLALQRVIASAEHAASPVSSLSRIVRSRMSSTYSVWLLPTEIVYYIFWDNLGLRFCSVSLSLSRAAACLSLLHLWRRLYLPCSVGTFLLQMNGKPVAGVPKTDKARILDKHACNIWVWHNPGRRNPDTRSRRTATATSYSCCLSRPHALPDSGFNICPRGRPPARVFAFDIALDRYFRLIILTGVRCGAKRYKWWNRSQARKGCFIPI